MPRISRPSMEFRRSIEPRAAAPAVSRRNAITLAATGRCFNLSMIAFSPLLASALREHPLGQRGFGESQSGGAIVIYPRILGIDRVSPRFPPCRDSVTRSRDGNDLVGVAVERPQRRGSRPGAIIGRLPAATDHR